MAAPLLTLHLVAADGATFQLQIPAPVVRNPTIRVAGVRGYAVRAVYQWDGSKWALQ